MFYHTKTVSPNLLHSSLIIKSKSTWWSGASVNKFMSKWKMRQDQFQVGDFDAWFWFWLLRKDTILKQSSMNLMGKYLYAMWNKSLAVAAAGSNSEGAKLKKTKVWTQYYWEASGVQLLPRNCVIWIYFVVNKLNYRPSFHSICKLCF